MNISERLKKIRGASNQEDFAKQIQVSKMTLGRWERGERGPDYETLQNMLKTFPDINPAWLLSGEGPMKRGELDIESQEFKRHKPIFAKKFKQIRGNKSIEEFCSDIHYLSDAWWEFEENIKDPSCYFLSVICFKLGISPAWLIDDEGPMLKADICCTKINTGLLQDVIKEAELHESINPGSLSLDKKAELMAELYAMKAVKGGK